MISYEAPYSTPTTSDDIRPGGGEERLHGDFDCILLGAKRTGEDTALQIAAMGDRLRFETETHFWNNGVFWYRRPGQSAGFAGSSDLLLDPGDKGFFHGATRLSWHIDTGTGGYRAGRNENLDGNPTWRKVLMHGPQGVFCSEEVCGADEVLRFAGLLSHCSGRFCTAEECCAKRGSCTEEVCPSSYLLKRSGQLPELCANTTCRALECCSEKPRCSPDICSQGFVLRPGYAGLNGPLCSGHECTQPECCQSAPTCPAEVCSGELLLRSPPPLCKTFNCTTAECCRPTGQCEASVCPPGSALKRTEALPAHCASILCEYWECCRETSPVSGVTHGALADLDLDAGSLGGNITWIPPSPLSDNVSHFHFAVYLDWESQQPQGAPLHLGNVSWGTNMLSIPAGTPAAPWLSIHTCNTAGCHQGSGTGGSRPEGLFPLSDVVLSVGSLSFEDLDLDDGEVGGVVTWDDVWPSGSNALASVCKYAVALGVNGGGEDGPPTFFLNRHINSSSENGISVLVLDETLQQLAPVGLFHTGSSTAESFALERFLDYFPDGMTVLLAGSGRGVADLHTGARAAIAAFGAQLLGDISSAGSYAFIGRKAVDWQAVERWAPALNGRAPAAVAELQCPLTHFVADLTYDGQRVRLGTAGPSAGSLQLPEGSRFPGDARSSGALELRAASLLREQTLPSRLKPVPDEVVRAEAASFTPDEAASSSEDAVSGDVAWRVMPGLETVLSYRVYLAGQDDSLPRLPVGNVAANGRRDYALRVPPGMQRGNFSRIVIYAVSELAEQSRPSAEVPLPETSSLALSIAVVATASALGAARVVSAVQAVEAAGKMAVEGTDLHSLERCATRMEALKPQPASILGKFTASTGESVVISGIGELPYLRDFISPLFPGCVHHHHRRISLQHSSGIKDRLFRHRKCENSWDSPSWVLKKLSNSTICLQGPSGEPLLLHRSPPRCGRCLKGRMRTLLRLYAPLLVLVAVSAMVVGLQYWAVGALLLGFALLCLLVVVTASRCPCIHHVQRCIQRAPPAVIRAPFWRWVEMLIGLLPCVPAFMAGTLPGLTTGCIAVLGALAKSRDADLLASLLEIAGGACVAVMCFLARIQSLQSNDSNAGVFGSEEGLMAVMLTSCLLFVKGVDDWVAGLWTLYLNSPLQQDVLLTTAERTAASSGVGLGDAMVLEAFASASVEEHMRPRLANALQRSAIEVSRRGMRTTRRLLEELFGQSSGWRRVTVGLAKHLSKTIDAADGLTIADAPPGGKADKSAHAAFQQQVESYLETLQTSLRQLLMGPLATKTLAHSRASATTIMTNVSRLQEHVETTEACVGTHPIAGHQARSEFLVVLGSRVGLVAEEVRHEIRNSHLSSIDLCLAQQRLAEMQGLVTQMSDSLNCFGPENCSGYENLIQESSLAVSSVLQALGVAAGQLQQMAGGTQPGTEQQEMPQVRIASLLSLDTVASGMDTILSSQRRLGCLVPKAAELEVPQLTEAEADLCQCVPGRSTSSSSAHMVAPLDLREAAPVLCIARTVLGLTREVSLQLYVAAEALEAAASLLEAARGEAVEVLDTVTAARGKLMELSKSDLLNLRQLTTAFATAGPVRALVLLQGLSSDALQGTYRTVNHQMEVLHSRALELLVNDPQTATIDLSLGALQPSSEQYDQSPDSKLRQAGDAGKQTIRPS